VIDELFELQARQREAHLSRDASRMAALFADDFVSVRDGEVTRPSRDESRERFERYFARVRFVAWDDIAEPVIEVSDDGTLATVLVRKRVHVAYVEANGQPAEEETVFAWVEVWRRQDHRWVLAMVSSTNAASRTVTPAPEAPRTSFVDLDGTVYPLPAGSSIVGRTDHADVTLPDIAVARRHARVDVSGERVVIMDLGSPGGTWVNGGHVSSATELRPGDTVRLGTTTLTLHAQVGAADGAREGAREQRHPPDEHGT
jgi:pSer/pThr/pTyr-binding forkhead associated (FHA) protein